MNSEDFELETRLSALSIEQDRGMSTSSENERQLAELIANCVADVEEASSDLDHNNKSSSNETTDNKEDELPTSLIVTNLPKALFAEQHLKTELEALFRTFDESATFHYLRSFRRARVDFCSNAIASKARLHLHHTPFGDSVMNCFFGQPPLINKNTQQFLQIPPPVRQFLISPPASPPVDWAPALETEPVINFDLLSALASLGPGDKHELLPASDNKPGIVIHVCGDMETGGTSSIKQQRGIIAQTPCPKRN